MRLTKNEKKVLKLLLQDARMSDSAIAVKLKISGQAVGKIRKKLEGTLIDSYSLSLNYSRLGIQTFVISLSKITPEGMNKGELEIERTLLDTPNLIRVYRLPNSNYTHILLYGFESVDTVDEFFHSKKNKQQLHKYIENKQLFTFSHNSLIKDSPLGIFTEMIEGLGSQQKTAQREIDHFKKRLGK